MHQDNSNPAVDISMEDDLENPKTRVDLPQLKTNPQPRSHSCGDDSCHIDHDAESWVRKTGLPQRQHAPKMGRNDPCLCGSGKKYKKCCLGVAVA